MLGFSIRLQRIVREEFWGWPYTLADATDDASRARSDCHRGALGGRLQSGQASGECCDAGNDGTSAATFDITCDLDFDFALVLVLVLVLAAC